MKQSSIYEMLCGLSKEEFIVQYSSCNEIDSKNIYFQVLLELKNALLAGDIDYFKEMQTIINYICCVKNQELLEIYNTNTCNPFCNTNLIILACKYNKLEVLQYILDYDFGTFCNLSLMIGGKHSMPDDEDEDHHNAFYYAIRSCNTDLLTTLIDSWLEKYLLINECELDELLSRTYEELKLKNIEITGNMEMCVLERLINLRFLTATCLPKATVSDRVKNIKERIELIIENILLLNKELSNARRENVEVDETSTYLMQCIAQNIHIVKKQLKSTYSKLPWEEIEFLLVIRICCRNKYQELALFYYSILNLENIQMHLDNFVKSLRNEIEKLDNVNLNKLNVLPKLKREEVVSNITSNNPMFANLYSDYQQIRDFYSLTIITRYLESALIVDCKERAGPLLIIRSLQVIGEHSKDTLESPKLSNTTSDLLIYSLPSHTRQLIKELRDCISHSHSLAKREEILRGGNPNIFINIQKDIRKINGAITDILYRQKTKLLKNLLEKIVSCENPLELKRIAKVLNIREHLEMSLLHFKLQERYKIKTLIHELTRCICDMTNYEIALCSKINEIIEIEETKRKSLKTNYSFGLLSLTCLDKIMIHNMKFTKFKASELLKSINFECESQSLEDIAALCMKLYTSIVYRKPTENHEEMNRLFCEIFLSVIFDINNIRWIGAFRDAVKYKKEKHKNDELHADCDSQLHEKCLMLADVFRKNDLFEKITCCKSVIAVVEMLVLDIMSLLDSARNLTNNLFFLDNHCPIMIGKCLRNHLAHDNALMDTLLSDPSLTLILNARKLIVGDIIGSGEKIGKVSEENLLNVRAKHNRNFKLLNVQRTLFTTIANGKLEEVKHCVSRGADINGRTKKMSSALHFAAKGLSLEVVKFVFDHQIHTNMKDSDGLNALHIACAYGRVSIVQYLVKEGKMLIDDINNSGKTCLHIAAENGHKDVVHCLINNNADIYIKDDGGMLPFHYAIRHNHEEIVQVFIEHEKNIINAETLGDFTPLHIAAEYGHLGIVDLLVTNNVNVSSVTDLGATPLHLAALNGYLEVVNVLIANKVDVSAKTRDGGTALHYAVENGHVTILQVLLENDANVNAVDMCNWTPLHYATYYGKDEAVRVLLEHKSDLHVHSIDHMIPLHYAAILGYLDIGELLIENGTSINSVTNNGQSALHLSAMFGHSDVLNLLLKKEADVNLRDKKNMTPFHIAVRSGNKEVVQMLMTDDLDVNSCSKTDFTALHISCINGYEDIMRFLIKRGADVNAKGRNGMTPLHVASVRGMTEIVVVLLELEAEVNIEDDDGFTALHYGVLSGNKTIVHALVHKYACVNLKNNYYSTPLHLAAQGNNREIIKLLLQCDAAVNAEDKNGFTPLYYAVKKNCKEIMHILIENGADVNVGSPLMFAIFYGYKDAVNILIKDQRINIHSQGLINLSPLHAAAFIGNTLIADSLLGKGAQIDVEDSLTGSTPLHVATEGGHRELAVFLMENNANVNIRNREGCTPLHIAGKLGYAEIAHHLLKHGADPVVRNNENISCLELAVYNNHQGVAEILLKQEAVNINFHGNLGFTVLHIAAQRGFLELTQFLVNRGADIYASAESHAKPIHIAVKEGQLDVVNFYLFSNIPLSVPDNADNTVLHYAALGGQIEMTRYLINQNVDVNIPNALGRRAIHIASQEGHKEIVQILLENGAYYNVVDFCNRTPKAYTKNEDCMTLFITTEGLFEAIKHKNSEEVEAFIKKGAIVNAKNYNDSTSLYYAIWKICVNVINTILRNTLDSYIMNTRGWSPLHYACKYSHVSAVKLLLSNGAIHDAFCDRHKTPLDFAGDPEIINLLKIVNTSFMDIESGNVKIIQGLENVYDNSEMKIIMNARNRENQSLLTAAVHSNFPELTKLKAVFENDGFGDLVLASVYVYQEEFTEALHTFESVLAKRMDVVGPDNPVTWEIQKKMAVMYYKQHKYSEALNILEGIYKKQQDILGTNNQDTLKTRSEIALVFHRQGKDEAALEIFRKVCLKQENVLGKFHDDVVETRSHMALVLNALGKFEEAININLDILGEKKGTLGSSHPLILTIQNNIALVLMNFGRHDEALEIFEEVYTARAMVLGINHSDTLRTRYNMVGILMKQKQYDKALDHCQEIRDIQRTVLGPFHYDTLITQEAIADISFFQGKYIKAILNYQTIFEHKKHRLGFQHPHILNIQKKIEFICLLFKWDCQQSVNIVEVILTGPISAAQKGDLKVVMDLIRNGIDVNFQDPNGKTPLSVAVTHGHKEVVAVLLEHGADVTLCCDGENTPLHIAVSKGDQEMTEMLLQHTQKPHT